MKRLLLVGTAILLLLAAAAYVMRDTWLEAVAAGLVCQTDLAPADAILVENIEVDYLLFERAQQLEAQGLAPVVLVPIMTGREDGKPGRVQAGFAEVMCEVARLKECDYFAVREEEPITLNFARGVAEELRSRGFRSVVLVVSGFRSQRAFEVYQQVFTPMGIEIRCEPVFGPKRVDNWSDTLHGIQEVGLQLGKLWYYRLFVLLVVGS